MIINRIQVGILATNCYIIKDQATGEGVVIDPGAASQKIISAIDEMGVCVKYIFLTHAHFDHVFDASYIKEHTGAKIVVSRTENELLKTQYVCEIRPSIARKYNEVSGDILVDDQSVLKVGNIEARFISTPGHTPGSCVIIMGDCMFSGDTLFKGTCGRCDFPRGDYSKMLESLKKLYFLDGDFKVYPGHMEETTLDYERKTNCNMREAVGK